MGKRILVIGVGRDKHGDDAAGLVVAQRLEKRLAGIGRVALDNGSCCNVLDACEHENLVIILDAAEERTGWQAGAWSRIPFPQEAAVLGKHKLRDRESLKIDTMLRRGKALGHLPASVCLYAIAGRSFAAEAPLSSPVAGAVDRLAGQVESDVREWLRLHEGA
jgi:hydrogenase maturation protease